MLVSLFNWEFFTVTKKALWIAPILLSFPMAHAQTKVGIIHIQNAIIATRDGQKAAQDLQTKFAPKQKELES